jgi:hypothetical protein
MLYNLTYFIFRNYLNGLEGALYNASSSMTSPQPLSDLTPPSPTGRGRKYGEKIMVERGFSK